MAPYHRPRPWQCQVSATDLPALRSRLRERMPALDGLRGLAIIAVVWHNAGLLGGVPRSIMAKLFDAVANAGWVGVQLFFVLSGFLITGILLDTRDQPHAWRNFMARRALRIFPLYYSVLALFFIVLPLIGMLPSWLARDYQYQFWYWTYLANWSAPYHMIGDGLGQVWSLCVEEQFYLVWPLAALWLAPRKLTWLCAGLAVAALVARASAQAIMPTPFAATEFAYGNTIARFDGLTLGALVAIGLRDSNWAPILTRHARPLGLALLIIVTAFAVSQRGFGNMHWPVLIYGSTLSAMLFAVVVLIAAVPSATGGERLAATVGAGWLRFMGKHSYAIYLFHIPVSHVLKGFLPVAAPGLEGNARVIGLAAFVLAVFLISLALALLSWRLIEAPALSLKRFFPSPRTP